ncbi:predicted protein [Scheffersomyces stipitis CBS 6054]|uniref:Uncharacterized protein n=1 Tax=Scheffersomyces stipitis (strain ATCC 58785 / CBS 6054 / NBRC 10063 / NRRL Y-11545) TaxID=322104 RepID=A3LRS7_PICST|nr:predicted protein [Scheffersomyces stipitis CBS 6054]ABN65440.2 predicted protein [Scheffersomyces stipitis CBS 6054]KAG2733696.1 hypothetical protein G9P44_003221 [Scheffersomyces stipitis]
MASIWYALVLLYPATFVATLPFFFLFKQFGSDIARIPVIKFLEDYIIKNYGYFWFTLVYFAFLFGYVQPNGTIPWSKIVHTMKWYGANTVVFFLTQSWFFGFSIFERINIATGGHCLNEEILSEYECKSSGEKWINGFDSSGHFYFIISISLVVGRELLVHLPLPSKIRLPNGSGIDLERATPESRTASTNGTEVQIWDNKQLKLYRLAVVIVALSFMAIWFFMYLITCIFFHTVGEKIVGTIVGGAVPLALAYFDI